MWDNILQGFMIFATWQNVLVIAIGMIGGVLIGAIPGLTATMAVVILLPFTFAMPPETGMLMLVAVYKGSVFAGSIPAILIRTPGTPAAACTVLDGYPLARKGESRKALEMSLYASCTADLISNLALIFFAGLLASFALRFGPPEFFWLITFSLTVVIAVSGKSLIKGLLSGVLGLLISLIGLDLVYGTERLTFGQSSLMSGLGFLPLLIGLFAIPEVLNFYAKRAESFHAEKSTGEKLTLKEYMRSLFSIVRGSIIGVVVGAIPGTGASTAAFLSYGEAKRTSKRRENFGKGELEGVAAAESGNNGVAGATLIPLLSLGVPGDVVTAVMLGAFLIHGLTPGPLLFRDDIGFVYAIFCGIMLASVFLLIAGKVAIKYFSKISDIKPSILFPMVLLFCVFGSFAVDNNPINILVMALMGILGFAMLRLDIPQAPLLIGFVLGPLLEDNFRRAILIGGGRPDIFFRNEICYFFIFLTILSIIISIYQHRKTNKR